MVGEEGQKVQTSSHKINKPWSVWSSMVIILYCMFKSHEKVDLTGSPCRKRMCHYVRRGMLTRLIVGIILQYKHVSNRGVAHPKQSMTCPLYLGF